MPGRSETDTDMRWVWDYGRGGKRRCLGPERSHCSRFPLRTTYKRSQIREFAPPIPIGGSPRTDRIRTYGLGRRGERTQRQSHTRGVGGWEEAPSRGNRRFAPRSTRHPSHRNEPLRRSAFPPSCHYLPIQTSTDLLSCLRQCVPLPVTPDAPAIRSLDIKQGTLTSIW